MKNLFIILLSMLSVLGLSAQAQTKKPATKTTTTTKKTTSTTKKTPAKTTTTTKATPAKTATTSTPVQTEEKVVAKSNTPAVKQSKANTGSSSYKTALGIKFIYGISFTGKFFIKDNAALEGILRYNGAGGTGSNIAFSGLYEHHADIKTVEGLRWYIGGGGHVNYFSYKGGGYDPITSFGVVGILGLEYKIKSLPLAISADWQPGYMISPSSGFSAENGGIGVKYTF